VTERLRVRAIDDLLMNDSAASSTGRTVPDAGTSIGSGVMTIASGSTHERIPRALRLSSQPLGNDELGVRLTYGNPTMPDGQPDLRGLERAGVLRGVTVHDEARPLPGLDHIEGLEVLMARQELPRCSSRRVPPAEEVP
jgi:hypothetical protein